jgi:hypothetical protein
MPRKRRSSTKDLGGNRRSYLLACLAAILKTRISLHRGRQLRGLVEDPEKWCKKALNLLKIGNPACSLQARFPIP